MPQSLPGGAVPGRGEGLVDRFHGEGHMPEGGIGLRGGRADQSRLHRAGVRSRTSQRPRAKELAFAAPPLIRDGALDEDYLDQIVAAFAHQWG